MSAITQYSLVQAAGVVTHVMVPVEEFERLTGQHPSALEPPTDAQIDEAIAIHNDPTTKWHDAESVFQDIVRDGIEAVRRAGKMTQGELGEKIGLSQPQVSRMESDPESATLGVLRRIAEAMAGREGRAGSAGG